jgi:uncharacterized LabA/DUF88 family protein
MASPNDTVSMALYCDFENVALGVRDAKYDKFDIKPVLERLLLKGSIVVKKAYCDWDRYKEFKPQMHEASFELIEIPHVRQSGKNSADIRMVVDALDLCYTKAHVNAFVIISGDSDFSPLVSKLRENAKYVIGVGVKNSSSDLLIANCDEFIFIDDLVRESRRAAATREVRQAPPATRRLPDEENRRKEELETRKSRAVDMAAETFDALMAERGDSGKIWASALKQAIKRRKPDFNEASFGFRTFGNLLEEAQSRGLLEIGRDDKSGAYVYRSSRATAGNDAAAAPSAPAPASLDVITGSAAADGDGGKYEMRRNGRTGRKPAANNAPAALTTAAPEMPMTSAPPAQTTAAEVAVDNEPRRQGRGGRKPAPKKAQATAAQEASAAPETPTANAPPMQTAAAETPVKAARKPAARTRRPRKSEVVPSSDDNNE